MSCCYCGHFVRTMWGSKSHFCVCKLASSVLGFKDISPPKTLLTRVLWKSATCTPTNYFMSQHACLCRRAVAKPPTVWLLLSLGHRTYWSSKRVLPHRIVIHLPQKLSPPPLFRLRQRPSNQMWALGGLVPNRQ